MQRILFFIEKFSLFEANDWNPLHYASRVNAAEVVRALIEHGADVDAKTKEMFRLLMFCASKRGNRSLFCVDGRTHRGRKAARRARGRCQR